jgi:hypothetical protein
MGSFTSEQLVLGAPFATSRSTGLLGTRLVEAVVRVALPLVFTASASLGCGGAHPGGERRKRLRKRGNKRVVQ